MSLKRNVIANYLGQGYAALVGVVTLPLYLRYLGPEAYGLVGFFTTIQAWMLLLDLGMSPTLSREVVRTRAGALDNAELRGLTRCFEKIFAVMGAASLLAVWALSQPIAQRWLRVERLDPAEVAHCITLMGGMIAARWLAGLYRGGILGFERQVWLNGASVLVASLRSLAALALLVWVSRGVTLFFRFQLAVGLFELAIFAWKFYALLPPDDGTPVSLRASFQRVAGFAGSSAYVSVIWVLLTQVDKLILSRVLPLGQYGYFATAVAAASGIQALAKPVSTAFLPRLTYFFSQGREEEIRGLYSNATQLTLVITAAVAGVLVVFAKPVLYAWTCDAAMPPSVAKVLVWYALGNCILSVGGFQYYLQYAFGQLKLHVVYNTVLALVSVPLIAAASVRFGAVGAGVAWFGITLVSFAVWAPIVHGKLVPGFHRGWLLRDIAPILATTGVWLLLVDRFGIPFHRLDRIQVAATLGLISVATLAFNALASSVCRKKLRGGFIFGNNG